MLKVAMSTDLLSEREALLKAAMTVIANELKMADPADLVAYLRLEQFANLNDLLRSSTELYFKTDTVRFGYGGECLIEWGKPPLVSLDMEFVDEAVNAQFQLVVGAEECTVVLDRIVFTEARDDVEVNTAILRNALESCKLPLR